MKACLLIILVFFSISISAKNCGPLNIDARDSDSDESLTKEQKYKIRIDFLCNIDTSIYFSPKLKERGLEMKIIDNEFNFFEKLNKAQETGDYSDFDFLLIADRFWNDWFNTMKGVNIVIKVNDPDKVKDFVSFEREKVGLNKDFGQVQYLSNIYFVNTCVYDGDLMAPMVVPHRKSSHGWGLRSIPFNYCKNLILPANIGLYVDNEMVSKYTDTFDWYKGGGTNNVMDSVKFEIQRNDRGDRIRMKKKEFEEMVEFGEISIAKANQMLNNEKIKMSNEYYKLLLEVDALFENVINRMDELNVNYIWDEPVY